MCIQRKETAWNVKNTKSNGTGFVKLFNEITYANFPKSNYENFIVVVPNNE